MEQHDRLTMLKQLTFLGEKNINIFSSYIPDHYDEIYTLYTLLNKASLNYNDIEFRKPSSKDTSFIFICNLSDEYYNKLNDFLSSVPGGTIQYMRNKPFNVSLKKMKNNIHIKFKKI